MLIPTSFLRIIKSTYFLPVAFQLAALLAVVPIISATFLDTRAVSLPSGWTSLGCTTDDPSDPTLTAGNVSMGNMTVGWCVNYCVGLNLIYAGLGSGKTCYCGNELAQLAQNATETDCNTPCAGDSTEMCGAINPPRINLYCNTSATPPPAPTISQTSINGQWNYLGCYNDTDEGTPTTLGVSVTTKLPGGGENTTVENCTGECYIEGYVIAGMLWGNECYCDHEINYPGMAQADKDCRLGCAGNQSEICGGAYRLTVYLYTGLL